MWFSTKKRVAACFHSVANSLYYVVLLKAKTEHCGGLGVSFSRMKLAFWNFSSIAFLISGECTSIR